MTGPGTFDNVERYFKGLKRISTVLTGFALFLLAILSKFLFPEPIAVWDDLILEFVDGVRFVSLILVTLLYVTLNHILRKLKLITWVKLSFTGLFAFIILLLAYFYFAEAYTETYNRERVVVGAKSGYLSTVNDPELSPAEQIYEYDGHWHLIWPVKHYKRREYVLAILYVVTIPSGVCLLLISLHTVSQVPSPTTEPGQSRIDINQADEKELTRLTGVGPVKAQRLIDKRPYESVEDLLQVDGFGKDLVDKLRTEVVIRALSEES